jgi:DNA-binding NarL/FixJ family response regulator
MSKVRVLLADDHTLVRAGIRALLEKIAGFEVVAEASHGREAIELIQKHLPEIAILDITMKEINGLEVAARVTREFPSVKSIILSMHAAEEYVMRALQAGAQGYLLKDAAKSELELALKAVVSGQTYLSPSISRRVVEGYLSRARTGCHATEALTLRQRETLQLLAEGRTVKEIAFMLSRSVKTIEAHRAELMRRLNIHDLPGLVRLAMREGLIPGEG